MMESNSSVTMQFQGELERIMVSVFTGIPCILLLTINVIILYTLMSKPVFRETSRYILLTNLLVSDTVYITISQFLYILSNIRVFLSYPMCGTFVLAASLTEGISPLTLVVMSLERYVAVCFPLRHSNIVTMRSTAGAILIVWTFSFINILIRIALMCQFPYKELESLNMNRVCDTFVMFPIPEAAEYDRAFNNLLFVLTTFMVVSTYLAVSFAARSASLTNKVSAQKAQSTLMLHMIQLVLGLSSTIFLPAMVTLYNFMSWISFVRLLNFLYLVVFLIPRCLSSLIYGLRDRTIRAILLNNIFCGHYDFSNQTSGAFI